MTESDTFLMVGLKLSPDICNMCPSGIIWNPKIAAITFV